MTTPAETFATWRTEVEDELALARELHAEALTGLADAEKTLADAKADRAALQAAMDRIEQGGRNSFTGRNDPSSISTALLRKFRDGEAVVRNAEGKLPKARSDVAESERQIDDLEAALRQLAELEQLNSVTAELESVQ